MVLLRQLYQPSMISVPCFFPPIEMRSASSSPKETAKLPIALCRRRSSSSLRRCARQEANIYVGYRQSLTHFKPTTSTLPTRHCSGAEAPSSFERFSSARQRSHRKISHRLCSPPTGAPRDLSLQTYMKKFEIRQGAIPAQR